ncbi:MAG: 3-deoxy-manno-octulosonate cytidylyltransferase [Acidobacteriota bacterium]
MRIIGIIPARYGSTRFPGKPLAAILGKPMIAHVVERTRASGALAEVIVATDDARIAAAAREAGASVAMTPADLASGTDRVAWVARDRDADVIVNVQGDEPLLPEGAIEALVAPLVDDGAGGDVQMSTLAAPFQSFHEVLNPRTAKVVVNARGDALYFSRAPIPYRYDPGGAAGEDRDPARFLRHIGIYAYRAPFLQLFAATPPAPLEREEKLEQLRALHLGARLAVARVARGTVGVDTPEDLVQVERELLMASSSAVPAMEERS